ncbi:rho GTPase-activating protein 27 isoform X2 [Pantherophis guttatus]|uniref:Rho GTPase-activating protein 27 isoform X2 n=1 Tax=Pantherophis guttatus TaxID=94885 RepID=A0ABM3ZH79_PANGU|nr:rho GTPase-activating protein 27 isoform X2 [Pantherophis guttatus]
MESPGREEETYVLVEYAFEYTSKDGQLITIKPNERYMLLRRTNDHWWHIRKSKNSRPFYIPAKYVRELSTFMPSERPCHTTQLEAINLGTSIRVSSDQLPEYEYRFVTAVQESKTDTSQQDSRSLGMGTVMSREDNGKNLATSGAAKGTQPSLSASCSSLKPLYLTDSNHPLACQGGSAEHMRPAVSLNDLPRFTPPTQAGVGNSGLYKAASWAHPHPFLKNSSVNICKLVKDQVIQDMQECCAKELLEDVATDPIYVNIQELQLEHSTTTANDSQSPFQLCFSNPLNDWEIHTDTESGHFFYYNSVTGQTTWESPFGASLNSVSLSHSHCPSPVSSAEWNQYVDEASGQIFFYNAATGETSWEAPQEIFNPPEMRHAFTRKSPDRRPPTPETDYPKLSPRELSPKEGYSPDGSYKHFDYAGIPSADQGCASPGILETSLFDVPGMLKSLEKAGMMYRTRTADKGKRMRKNWACVWTVLEGGALIFFKDSKHSASSGAKYPSVLSSPEFTVDLRGASLSWAHKDRSSRKNVLELKTQDGSEYLIQHDLDSIANMWYTAINNRIGRLSIDFPLEEDAYTLATVKSKEQTGGNKEKESEKKHPAFWHSHSTDSDSNKIRNVLRKFLPKRPSLQYLRDRGYIKDQVFGCDLQVLCDREKSTVPNFVRQCIATVEKRGLDIDGLYRISGNLATIQNLRYKVDHDEHLDLDGGRWDDVHVITGALKLFFRELPEPLFPFSYFDRLIAAAKMIDSAKRSHHLREIVYSLPAANFNTLRVLFQHLSRVVEFREKNRMSLQSIAIVFGPTLLRPQEEEGNIAMYMYFQNQIMEQILSQTSYIFPES